MYITYNQHISNLLLLKGKTGKIRFLWVELFYAGAASWVGLFYTVFEIRWGYFTLLLEKGGFILRRFRNMVGSFYLCEIIEE